MNPLVTLIVPLFKRWTVVLVTGIVVAFNKKLGLNLDPTEIAGFIVAPVIYLVTDAWKAIADKHLQAAKLINTGADAVAQLTGLAGNKP